MTYVVLKEYLYDPIDCVKPAVAREPGKVYRKDSSFLFYILYVDTTCQLTLISSKLSVYSLVRKKVASKS